MGKRICIVNNNGSEVLFERPTGGVKRLWELYSHLCSSGYQVDVYCGCTSEELDSHNITGKSLNVKPSGKWLLSVPSLSIWLNNKKVYREIKKAGYDCVISFDVPSTAPACLSRIKNINYFIRQDLIEYRRIQYSARNMGSIAVSARLFLGWIMEGLCISRSERIISQCQVDIDAIRRRHPLLRRKIERDSRIQINNINPSWVHKDSPGGESQKKYDIGYVGNFDDDRKGHPVLLEAIEILRKRGKNYAAIFVGGGKKLDEYKNRYGHLDNVSFIGRVSDPTEYIRSMKLMVVPSQSDSCPNTIMEALYNGVAVIGAKSGGIPEILTKEDWLFELDANVLAGKICQLLDNDRTADLSAEQSVRANELLFDWGATIERLLFFN